MWVLSLLVACTYPDYATSEGTASVVLTPIDGEGYTIEADDLVAYGTDSWDFGKERYDTRVVNIEGSIVSPGPCFAHGDHARLEVELYGVPWLFFDIVPVGPEAVGGTADQRMPRIPVDAWSGDYVGEVELSYGEDDPCALPVTRHTLEVHWTLDEDTWVEVKTNGDVWPSKPTG